MATTPRAAVVTALEDGTDVVLADITCTELLMAAKAVSGTGGASGMATTRAALRFSIVEIGGKAVGWADLDEAGMKRLVPRTRDVTRLQKVFTSQHSPTEEESDAVIATLACEVGENERYTATLPGGRTVVFVECESATVEQALNEASLSAKSDTARGIQSLISGCQRSIRSVDGQPVTKDDLKGKLWDSRFSVRETHLLGAVYNHIHGLDGEEPGEVRPVLR